MKKIMSVLLFFCSFYCSYGQTQAIEELILNMEKLAQMKAMLNQMYSGYSILSNGYREITGLAKGNFDLHKNYLDGLLSVSPTVRNYKKVASIIATQALIIKEYKEAYNRFRSGGGFNAKELVEMGLYYNDLSISAARNLDELLMVISPGNLRMGDAERITAIDRIERAISDELLALREYNKNQNFLAIKKQQAKRDLEALKKLYGSK